MTRITITVDIDEPIDPANIRISLTPEGHTGEAGNSPPEVSTTSGQGPSAPVLRKLERFERYEPATQARQQVERALALGYSASAPARAVYVRLAYSGSRHRISLYINSAVLISGTREANLRAFAEALPGADTTTSTRDVYFRGEDALRALEAFMRYADGEDPDALIPEYARTQ